MTSGPEDGHRAVTDFGVERGRFTWHDNRIGARAMDRFFRRPTGRLTLVVGGLDLLLMGALALSEAADATRFFVALLVPLSIAAGIYIVALATLETPTPFPIGLAAMYMFLGGVFVYGLEQAATAGSGVGVLLVVLGGIAVVLGLRPTVRTEISPLISGSSSAH